MTKDEIDLIANISASSDAHDHITAACGLDRSAMTTALTISQDPINAAFSMDRNVITNAKDSTLTRLTSDFVLDPVSVRSQLDLAIGIGSHDPLSAITGAVYF